MAARGGQPGNDNATKGKPWAAALIRAAAQDPNKLRRIAEKVMEMAEQGDIAAIREIGDRLDGKPKQATEVSGEGGGPLTVQIMRFADRNASA